MSFVGTQTKKLLKRTFLLLGITALSLTRMFGGQDGEYLSDFSDKAKDILVPKASADVPYSQSSYYSQGGYGDDGGSDSAGGSSDAGGGSSDGSSSCGDGDSDGGCSLVVEYWNGSLFIPLDIYSPRYYQATLNTITVPIQAIQPSGEVRLRVTATKRHKVYFAGFVAPKEHLPYRTEQLSIKKVYHRREEKDYTETLTKPRSGKYLHTIPGDIIDLAFKAEEQKVLKLKSEQESFVLQAGGVYTAVSDEARQEAGDWVSQLDPESRAFLEDLRTLNTYHDSKKKVLS